jgi:hypothetical protein
MDSKMDLEDYFIKMGKYFFVIFGLEKYNIKFKFDVYFNKKLK